MATKMSGLGLEPLEVFIFACDPLVVNVSMPEFWQVIQVFLLSLKKILVASGSVEIPHVAWCLMESCVPIGTVAVDHFHVSTEIEKMLDVVNIKRW